MPNNFKLRGDVYVSKAGSDSNDGLTPETPKRTVQAGITATASGRTLIVGAGVYNESLVRSAPINIYADGYVVLDCSFGKTISFVFASSMSLSFYNIEIRNCGTFTSTGVVLTNCKVLNCSIYPGTVSNTPFYISNTIVVNCYVYSGGGIASLMYNCIIVNTVVLVVLGGGFYNNYVDPSSIISLSTITPASSVNFNNIQGGVIVAGASTVTSGVIRDTYGRYYDLSLAGSGGSGTIGDPYRRSDTSGKGYYFSDHRIAYPTFNVNSAAVDPGFNNILKQDFSLLSSSYHVGRASDYVSNIGGTQVATRINSSGSIFSGSNATVDSLVLTGFSDYTISGSALTGSVNSAPIFISSSAKVIQEIDYSGLLYFNKDTTAPSGSDVNVPDVLTYTSASGQAGANPDRLTYYMRWTTGSSQPATDAQWENGGLWPAGSFNVFEWNTKPSVDYLGRGNGDQNYNIVNTPTFVKATWIQLRVTLRNDYLI